MHLPTFSQLGHLGSHVRATYNFSKLREFLTLYTFE